MAVYDASSIPKSVYSSAKDPEIAEWLKTGPALCAHKPIHGQRREHDASTAHSQRCLEATQELVQLLGDALRSQRGWRLNVTSVQNPLA